MLYDLKEKNRTTFVIKPFTLYLVAHLSALNSYFYTNTKKKKQNSDYLSYRKRMELTCYMRFFSFFFFIAYLLFGFARRGLRTKRTPHTEYAVKLYVIYIYIYNKAFANKEVYDEKKNKIK